MIFWLTILAIAGLITTWVYQKDLPVVDVKKEKQRIIFEIEF